ncbi:MAG: SIS domain-containing protein [Planctomycetota bacterium]
MESILKDLHRILDAVPDAITDDFVESIVRSNRCFMHGLGRSGLVARMFAMRLVHLSQEATIVGDTTTPAIRRDDLLVVCSRTGRSPILRHAVSLAHAEGARAIAVIGDEGTRLEGPADLVVRLPIEVAEQATEQPMGSLWEQALLLYLDGVIVRKLMERLGLTQEDMERIHSNLP